MEGKRFIVRISARRLAEILELPRDAEMVAFSDEIYFDSGDLALRFRMPGELQPGDSIGVIHIHDLATTNPPAVSPSVAEQVAAFNAALPKLPQPGEWYTMDPTASPFVTLAPRDTPDAPHVVEG